MADRVVPFSSSPSPADPDPSALSRGRKTDLPQVVGRPDSKQAISGLRSLIAHGSLDSEALLQQIVDAAKALTDASGAAIAIRSDRFVVCRARAGETAPDLGTKLDVDSGISGECLRTGHSLRCDDTSKDLRVDAEVCARLGLRSLAAAPIEQKRGVVGIIEVFSSRPYSFPDRHLQLLEELAELAAAACAPVAESVLVPPELETLRAARAALALRFVSRASLLRKSAQEIFIRSISTRRRQIVLAAVAAVVLLSSLVWIFWNGHPRMTNLATVTAEAAAKNPDAPGPSADTALVWRGGVSKTGAKPRAGVTAGAAANNPRKDLVDGRVVYPEQPTSDPLNGTSSVATSPSESSQSTLPRSLEAQDHDNPPALSATGTSQENTSTLASVLSPPARLPQPITRVSQGISGGVLAHRVNPTYPSQALSTRLQGPVVLRAMITEDGSVHDLKVVSGQPILARAAVDAVRQWRYHPYRLDGTPVRMQTEITVDFKLP
jgi:TonB family protein